MHLNIFGEYAKVFKSTWRIQVRFVSLSKIVSKYYAESTVIKGIQRLCRQYLGIRRKYVIYKKLVLFSLNVKRHTFGNFDQNQKTLNLDHLLLHQFIDSHNGP